MRYTLSEWEAMKPTLQRLYMETGATLEHVGLIMAEEYNFHPPMRMYKYRFAEWGWRKYKRRKASTCQGGAPQPQQRCQNLRAQLQRQHVTSPDTFYVQELVIAASKDYCDASLNHGWSVGPLTISHHRYIPEKLPSFFEAQTQFQFTIHKLKCDRVDEAYHLLGQLFDFITGSEVYLHPKFVLSWALAGSVFFDLCSYAKDADCALVRALMRFSGANATAVFSIKSPNHPALRLMRTIAGRSSECPAYLRKVFRNAALASADSLERILGPLHPSVLFAHASVAWYWRGSESNPNSSSVEQGEVAARLAARYPAALALADAELGRCSDVSIGICYDFAHLLFCSQGTLSTFNTSTAITTAASTSSLPSSHLDLRGIADDLLDRTRVFTTRLCVDVRSETQRAHAFACMVQGVFALQKGHLGVCRAVFDDATSWFREGDVSSKMLADMMDADLDLLVEASVIGRRLEARDLNFARPRWFDGEKEVIMNPVVSDDLRNGRHWDYGS
ncbi:Clr5 domain-containing protein [Xylariales sp. PMI_506]|nr:Clr5 domain-containing protein [Xylariales sp. PMI_506]